MTREAKVRSLVAELFSVPESEVTLTARFVDDLGGDSLDIVELVMAVEEAFEIEIPDDDLERSFVTLGSVVEYLGPRSCSYLPLFVCAVHGRPPSRPRKPEADSELDEVVH